MNPLRILSSIVITALATIFLASCDDDDNELPKAGNYKLAEYSLEVHFINNDGACSLDCVAKESEPYRVTDSREYYKSTDRGFHGISHGNITLDDFRLDIVKCSDGDEYLIFHTFTQGKFAKTFQHSFHHYRLFGYNISKQATMQSYWTSDGTYQAVCKGVTFEGRDYPVTRSRYTPHAYEVVITLPGNEE